MSLNSDDDLIGEDRPSGLDDDAPTGSPAATLVQTDHNGQLARVSDPDDFWPPIVRNFVSRVRVLPRRPIGGDQEEPAERVPKPKKMKKPKKHKGRKEGRALNVIVVCLLGLGPLAFITTQSFKGNIKEDFDNLRAEFGLVNKQVTQYGITSVFPLADAEAKAERFATECFTHENLREDAQMKRLQATNLPAEYCGWNGKGNAQVISAEAVDAPYWVTKKKATVIVQVKLLGRSWFHLYVPFTSSDGKSAEFAGPPSLFGVATGATKVVDECSRSGEAAADSTVLKQTAQEFLSSLTGDSKVDVRRLLAPGVAFGDFSQAVRKPKVQAQVEVCQTKGGEQFFLASVTFRGPGKGSEFTFPYAFSAIPSPNSGQLYQVKSFGPTSFDEKR